MKPRLRLTTESLPVSYQECDDDEGSLTRKAYALQKLLGKKLEALARPQTSVNTTDPGQILTLSPYPAVEKKSWTRIVRRISSLHQRLIVCCRSHILPRRRLRLGSVVDRAEMDMGWVHPWVGLGWVGL